MTAPKAPVWYWTNSSEQGAHTALTESWHGPTLVHFSPKWVSVSKNSCYWLLPAFCFQSYCMWAVLLKDVESSSFWCQSTVQLIRPCTASQLCHCSAWRVRVLFHLYSISQTKTLPTDDFHHTLSNWLYYLNTTLRFRDPSDQDHFLWLGVHSWLEECKA